MLSASKRYNDYSQTLKKYFPVRVQKILVNAGFTCPNRDGSKGVGGCTYCNNQSFSPEYCQPEKTITQQIAEGIRFFRQKYPEQRYLVYFQSYTNTYADFQTLKRLYAEALDFPQVAGLVIGTRPDCISDELLDHLAQLSADGKYVMVEYGVESTHDTTLKQINRGHTYNEAQQAICATAERGILTAAHLILGLPNESRQMQLQTAERISSLPINVLKIHQLQLIRGTIMADQYALNPEACCFFTLNDYLELLVAFIERLKPKIAIERFVSQSPKELLLKPDWGLKNFEFTAKLDKLLSEKNTWQGRLYQTEDTCKTII